MLVDTPRLMEADAKIEADTDAVIFADVPRVLNAVQTTFVLLFALMVPVPSIVTFCDARRSVGVKIGLNAEPSAGLFDV